MDVQAQGLGQFQSEIAPAAARTGVCVKRRSAACLRNLLAQRICSRYVRGCAGVGVF
ncbi:protein of unknown function [Desulfovibrio sp. 86]|nr:protein of unknown function [Desulfovibrio sp. 86]